MQIIFQMKPMLHSENLHVSTSKLSSKENISLGINRNALLAVIEHDILRIPGIL